MGSRWLSFKVKRKTTTRIIISLILGATVLFFFHANSRRIDDDDLFPYPTQTSDRQATIATPRSYSLKKLCPNRHPVNWSRRNTHELGVKQVIDYIRWTNRTSCRLSHAFGGILVFNRGMDGQKSVCMDYEVRPESDNCLVYSFGINNEWSFDRAMESYGCEVYAFDPSMNRSHHHYSPKIHFYNWGLSDRDERWDDPLGSGWTLRSLDSIYRSLKHRGRIIDYLKMDIENSEWTVLPQIIASGMMDRVRQLALEIHLPKDGGIEEFRSQVAVLKSLEDNGWVRFDSSYNPWSMNWNSALDHEGPEAYELAWYNTKLLRLKKQPTPMKALLQHLANRTRSLKRKTRKRFKTADNNYLFV